MRTNTVKSAAMLIGLVCVNAILLFAVTSAGFAPWTIVVALLLGAGIGIYHDTGKHNLLFRVLAGIAGALFVCFGLMMSILGHLLR